MAAVTAANRVDTVFGDRRVIFVDLSSIDNNDTYVTGLQKVDLVSLTPSAAAAATQIGATVSGGTITFLVESGSLTAKAMIIGT